MRRFSVDIHRNCSIVARNQSVKERDFFFFSLHSCSMVKEMLVSIELRVSWKAVTPFFLMMQKLSST